MLRTSHCPPSSASAVGAAREALTSAAGVSWTIPPPERPATSCFPLTDQQADVAGAGVGRGVKEGEEEEVRSRRASGEGVVVRRSIWEEEGEGFGRRSTRGVPFVGEGRTPRGAVCVKEASAALLFLDLELETHLPLYELLQSPPHHTPVPQARHDDPLPSRKPQKIDRRRSRNGECRREGRGGVRRGGTEGLAQAREGEEGETCGECRVSIPCS